MSADPIADPTAALPPQRGRDLPAGRIRPGILFWPLNAILRLVVAAVVGRKLQVEGSGRVPRTGGVLLISNHISTADPPILGARSPRPLHFMAKAEWFKSRFLGWLGHELLCYPVIRHTADRGALRHTLELLKAGQAVAIYPEGTRTEDAQMREPEAGAGFLARHSGVPIVPVGIFGAERVWPKGRRLPHATEVHLVFGEPFSLPESIRDNHAAAEYMMARVASLLPPAYRGVFADRATGTDQIASTTA
ncbi:MAG: lysophospholipid acyltransferase family protein [Candidatus Dormibacteria bacterium]